MVKQEDGDVVAVAQELEDLHDRTHFAVAVLVCRVGRGEGVDEDDVGVCGLHVVAEEINRSGVGEVEALVKEKIKA